MPSGKQAAGVQDPPSGGKIHTTAPSSQPGPSSGSGLPVDRSCASHLRSGLETTGQKGEAQAEGKEEAREPPAALRAAWQSHPTLAGLPTHAGSTLGYLRWRVEPWAISQGSPALLEKPRASVPFRQEDPAAISGLSVCCGPGTELAVNLAPDL